MLTVIEMHGGGSCDYYAFYITDEKKRTEVMNKIMDGAKAMFEYAWNDFTEVKCRRYDWTDEVVLEMDSEWHMPWHVRLNDQPMFKDHKGGFLRIVVGKSEKEEGDITIKLEEGQILEGSWCDE